MSTTEQREREHVERERERERKRENNTDMPEIKLLLRTMAGRQIQREASALSGRGQGPPGDPWASWLPHVGAWHHHLGDDELSTLTRRAPLSGGRVCAPCRGIPPPAQLTHERHFQGPRAPARCVPAQRRAEGAGAPHGRQRRACRELTPWMDELPLVPSCCRSSCPPSHLPPRRWNTRKWLCKCSRSRTRMGHLGGLAIQCRSPARALYPPMETSGMAQPGIPGRGASTRAPPSPRPRGRGRW
mmetsp:Transcript_120506/g.323522  ORF Transcript_120506/g.323522 Transcript_120506/m.323522 type:complete len:244 (-) Transcript_120506:291-1022(-)